MKRIFCIIVLFSFWLTGQDLQKPADERFIPIKEKIAIIKLKTSDTFIYRTVNITPTEIFIIEFPEEMLLDGDVTTAVAVGHSKIIKPTIVPSPLQIRVKAISNHPGANSNLQIKTNAGITVILNFVITTRDKASNRIIFTFPELSKKSKKDRDSFLALKMKLQQEHKESMDKLKEEANRMRIESNTKAFSEFFMCNEYVNREAQDHVFFTSTRICKIGGKHNKGGDIYINFYIKNRFRNYFYVKDIKVYAVKGEAKVPIDTRKLYLERYGLKFDEVLNGAVGFELDEYAQQYILELEEEAGKKRKIRISIGF